MNSASFHVETLNFLQETLSSPGFYVGTLNFVLAALFWTMLGRFLLGLFIGDDHPNYILRFFRLLTNPVLRVTHPLTPRFIDGNLTLLYAGFWLMLARFVMYFTYFVALAMYLKPEASIGAVLLVAAVEAGLQLYSFRLAFFF